MTFLCCTSGQALVKAGKAVAETFISGASAGNRVVDLISGAVATINDISRYDWEANWATLPVNTKGIVTEAVSNLAAVNMIVYDMSGYASRVDAEDIINVHRDGWLRNMSLLRDEETRRFIQKGSTT